MISGIPDPDPLADKEHPSDEAEQVLKILRGAARGPRDPDLDLAVVIAGLREADDDAFRSAFAALVAYADLD